MNQGFTIGEHYSEAFKSMQQKEVVDNLEGICYMKKEGGYTKILTQDELAERKSRLAEVAIALARIEEKKKEYMDEIKEMLTEPKADYSELLTTIKHKTERCDGMLYMIDEQEIGMMYSFDNNGVCVDARPLLPNEKQTKLRTINMVSNGE